MNLVHAFLAHLLYHTVNVIMQKTCENMNVNSQHLSFIIGSIISDSLIPRLGVKGHVCTHLSKLLCYKSKHGARGKRGIQAESFKHIGVIRVETYGYVTAT